MGLIVVALAVLLLVILGVAVVALAFSRGGSGETSPPYDADRYEATERFRNNLPPSI